MAFLGGATIGLWISDPLAPPVRATEDVDVIVAVTYSELEGFADRMRARGFRGDTEVICRHRHSGGLVLDVMPIDSDVLGFTNRWYADAVTHVGHAKLPSGSSIRVVTPPWLLATKLEAYLGRGGDDPMASADFEDIVRLVDGREELNSEIAQAPPALREFVTTEMGRLAARPDFDEAVEAALPLDPGSQARAGIVIGRWAGLSAGD